MKPCYLGIDIGGTKIAFGIVDQSGEILHAKVLKTADFITIESLSGAINAEIEQLTGDLRNPEAIGIGAPNGNIHTGMIEDAPNLSWKGHVPIVSVFEHAFGKKCYLTNDANAAALGEMLCGNAKNLRDFISVTLGTGVGSGIVCNGELLYGYKGMAGELGHITIEINGRLCACGRRGCLERYASATGFQLTFKELLSASARPEDQLPEPFSSKDIADAAHAGNETALAAMDKAAHDLAFGLSTAAAVTNPEAIILSGGLSKAGDLLLKPLRKHFADMAFQAVKDTSIIHSELPATHAAIIGAAALAMKN